MSPHSAPHPCASPGCHLLVPRGRSYCGAHEVTQSQRRAKDPEQQRFYSGRRWTVLSQLVRRQEPLCAMCKVKPSAVADHIDGNWQNNARENLRGLCIACNASHTAKQHRAKAR